MNKKKLELLVVKPSDNFDEVVKKFTLYLQRQGIKVIKGNKNEK